MKKLLIFFAVFTAIISCTEDTFDEGAGAATGRAPENLEYSTSVLARANGAVSTAIPTYNSYGEIPFFVVTAMRDKDGNAVDPDVMEEFISIKNPKATVLDITPAELKGEVDENGLELTVPIDVVNHRDIGKITIADGNPFGIGEYSFDVLMLTKSGDKTFQTMFENVLKVNLGPLLTKTLLYVPGGQNLLSSSGGNKTTTAPRTLGGNPAVRFELSDNLDKFSINEETGAITLLDGYVPNAEPEIVSPTIKVISTISEEVVEFNSSIQIHISENPVVVPKLVFTVFYPEFETPGDGYRIYTDEKVDNGSQWVFLAPISQGLAGDRPAENTGQKRLDISLVRPSTANQLPHDTWAIMNSLDLTAYSVGFDVELEFFSSNRWLEYFSGDAGANTPGESPSFLDLYVSTDYTGSVEDATWTKLSDDLTCYSENGPTFTDTNGFKGYPYPGDQGLRGFPNPEGRKRTGVESGDHKWVKSTLDLVEAGLLDSANTTFAFRVLVDVAVEEVNGEPQGLIFPSGGRTGQFWISDFNIIASEK